MTLRPCFAILKVANESGAKVMGEITYQGDSPYSVTPAQPSIARVSGRGVRMTVYASVERRGPAEFQIEVPMKPDEARQLAAQLTAAAIDVERRGR